MLIGVAIAFFCTPLINEQNSQEGAIKLNGALIPTTVKSPDVVTVFQTENSIEFEFLSDTGNFTVTITDAKNQTVYQTTVDTETTTSLTVFTINWTEGYYVISFTDKDDGYLEGNVYING
jgi:hypothetical protein